MTVRETEIHLMFSGTDGGVASRDGVEQKLPAPNK